MFLASRTSSDSPPGETLGKLFTSESKCKQHIAAPMLRERESYLAFLLDSGRPRKSAARTASLLNEVVTLLDLPKVGLVQNEDVKAGAVSWQLRSTNQTRRTRDFEAAAREFLKFLRLFRTAGDLPEGYVEEFEDFSKAVGIDEHYSNRTKHLIISNTRRFLSWAWRKKFPLEIIELETIEQFILEKETLGLRYATVVHYLSSLKVFFEHAEVRGWNRNRLNRRIDKPTRPKRVPRTGPPWRQIRLVLGALDETKATESRAKAILILASVYGLRSAEISRLRLSDFDWASGVLTVRRSKRGRTQVFPIQPELRDAVGKYIERFRPECQHDEVFISHNTPYRPTKNLVLTNTLETKGVFSKRYGLHAFRHSCATELLRQGTSLRGIADFLGHKNLQTVSVYAHCDNRALRRVAEFRIAEVL